jgi:SAM-dependent methyltransferase
VVIAPRRARQRGAQVPEPAATTSVRSFQNPAALSAQHAFFVRFLDVVNALPGTRANHQRVIQLLAPQAGQAILDVGCGTGSFDRSLAPLVGATGRVVGLDQSEEFLAVAATRSDGMSPPLEFVVGDANALPFADATFDGCRTERVLQYLEDPAQGLAEMVRVTKPGGRVVASEVDWDSYARDLPGVDRELQRRAVWALGDVVGEAWMGRQLRRRFLEAGMEDVTCEGVALIFTDPETPKLLDLPGSVERLHQRGVITAAESSVLLDATAASCVADQFFISTTLFTVSGRKPL